jgi:hypothetical protein
MSLRTRFKNWREQRKLIYARGKLEGKPSPFREGAPEKAQSAAGGTAETRFIP